MGQSKLPAKCSECGLVGPSRKKATKGGWVRKSGRDPDWLCPEHGPEWQREEDARLEVKDRKLQASRAKLARIMPILPTLMPRAFREHK
jgi:hypothetical protein